MVSFYKPAKKTSRQAGPRVLSRIYIDELDMQGQGVSTTHQPVLFVDGALPGETVDVQVTQSQKHVLKGKIKKLITPAADRKTPFCPHYAQCGGCQLQHVDTDSALEQRQQAMDTYWQHQLKLDSLPWQPAITGARPAYRRKARLSVDARDTSRVRLGYRQEGSKKIVDVTQCPILVPSLQSLIMPLRNTLHAHTGSRFIGHIHLLAGDNVCQVTLKATRDLSDAMLDAWQALASEYKFNLVLQDARNHSHTLHQHETLVCQTEAGLTLSPDASDFVQVNGPVNQKMIAQAMQWLDPQPDEIVADWFAGLGNFSLSLAQRVRQVHAVEGVASMVHKALGNAQAQGIDNIHFVHLDLSDEQKVREALSGEFTRMLLDPSREGAAQVCQQLASTRVQQVLYVSCNPSSFTRDAGYLMNAGYRIDKISLIEMFPYTRHLEVMALFSRPSGSGQ